MSSPKENQPQQPPTTPQQESNPYKALVSQWRAREGKEGYYPGTIPNTPGEAFSQKPLEKREGSS